MQALNRSPMALRLQIISSPLSQSPKPNLIQNLRSSFTGVSIKLRPKLAGKVARNRRVSGAVMMDSAAASYATALADVAKHSGTLETTSSDLEKIESIFKDDQIFEFFTNPVVSIENKREVLDQITESAKLQRSTANLLNILVDAKRSELIRDIVKEFEVVYNKLTDTELAIVGSVVKLEGQQLAQIASQVQRLTGAKNVRIKTVIEPELLAGFTIRYGSSGSKLIDMSVKKQLQEIAGQLDLEEMVGSFAA
ncbi:hypothetical protein AMTRI_Chr03g139270 [Amborella trichopoda]|uniref:ATP synthase delta chain, chloroplastic n=1 Tax=Amborella trichopoda TaxID=13333 RepID=W1PVK0_AMBTC|nr:ATP synthase subunit delta, chloroplastic [Amborella trichopoda]ERN11716.1 hypothetical protein AMTR_s00022p00232380 [Amborella trichopoda]|eukprot:XP_006850135.1 ATP synthase subunit delta, chloroplastic [Amborella trichopoda]